MANNVSWKAREALIWLICSLSYISFITIVNNRLVIVIVSIVFWNGFTYFMVRDYIKGMENDKENTKKSEKL